MDDREERGRRHDEGLFREGGRYSEGRRYEDGRRYDERRRYDDRDRYKSAIGTMSEGARATDMKAGVMRTDGTAVSNHGPRNV